MGGFVNINNVIFLHLMTFLMMSLGIMMIKLLRDCF